ncbi:MAG: hypothetical protein Q9227_008841 [Pyrenula ochraceoflavens]
MALPRVSMWNRLAGGNPTPIQSGTPSPVLDSLNVLRSLSSHKEDVTTPFRLLELPAEIRQIIFEHCVNNDLQHYFNAERRNDPLKLIPCTTSLELRRAGSGGPANFSPASEKLLYASRQVYSELLPIFYRGLKFHFDMEKLNLRFPQPSRSVMAFVRDLCITNPRSGHLFHLPNSMDNLYTLRDRELRETFWLTLAKQCEALQILRFQDNCCDSGLVIWLVHKIIRYMTAKSRNAICFTVKGTQLTTDSVFGRSRRARDMLEASQILNEGKIKATHFANPAREVMPNVFRGYGSWPPDATSTVEDLMHLPPNLTTVHLQGFGFRDSHCAALERFQQGKYGFEKIQINDEESENFGEAVFFEWRDLNKLGDGASVTAKANNADT